PLKVVRFDATTLWHFDAAEWAPSTASNPVIRRCRLNVRFARKRTRLAIYEYKAPPWAGVPSGMLSFAKNENPAQVRVRAGSPGTLTGAGFLGEGLHGETPSRK